jgi:hypothetical protein
MNYKWDIGGIPLDTLLILLGCLRRCKISAYHPSKGNSRPVRVPCRVNLSLDAAKGVTMPMLAHEAMRVWLPLNYWEVGDWEY